LAFANNAIVGLVIALVVWGIMSLIAYFQGDSILLGVAGAKKIQPSDHPRLYNVVEEMKIASGLEKMPDVYIIDDPALNAFATGRDLNHASVAITSGLLQKLNRDELEGVIGHEISHIKNRDVLLMSMCSVLLGTIVILSFYASRVMMFGAIAGGGGGNRRSSSRNNGGGGGALIIMVFAILLMILAPIFAQLIYFAISRRREYLADASSALYTRYPEGLASALEKLAQSTTPVKAANQATAPMYIVNPFRNKSMSVSDWTSTHPPIQERIRILRAMAGGASFANYDRAFRTVKNTNSGIISDKTAAAVGAVGLRAAVAEGPVETAAPVDDKMTRTREVNDMMYRMNDYKTIQCECGAKLKVPPSMQGSVVKCPRCGRFHQT
jgi:heat shock protein HtpX